jgi:Ca2+-binding EF-hand superfamily protein
MSDHYAQKIGKFFTLLNGTGEGTLSIDDLYDAADRVSAVFQHPPGSVGYEAIHDAYSRLWQEVYSGMDHDDDQRVTAQEFLTAHEVTILNPPGGYTKIRAVAQALFDLADLDRDGAISREDYIQVMTQAFRLPEQEAGIAFDSLVEKVDGSLTSDQVHRATEGFFCSDTPGAYGATMFGPI